MKEIWNSVFILFASNESHHETWRIYSLDYYKFKGHTVHKFTPYHLIANWMNILVSVALQGKRFEGMG